MQRSERVGGSSAQRGSQAQGPGCSHAAGRSDAHPAGGGGTNVRPERTQNVRRGNRSAGPAPRHPGARRAQASRDRIARRWQQQQRPRRSSAPANAERGRGARRCVSRNAAAAAGSHGGAGRTNHALGRDAEAAPEAVQPAGER